MKFISRLITVLLLMTSCALAQNWLDARSANLRLVTNGSAKQATETLYRFEQIRTSFGRLLARSRINCNVPLLLIGVRTSEEARALGGSAKPVRGGYALAADDRQYLVLDLSASDWSGLYRAYGLLLLNANYPRTQPWFDEGLAQYLAGTRFVGNELEIAAPPELAESLAQPTTSFAEFVSQGAASSPAFRASAFLFFRWIVDNQRMEDVARYFGLVMTRGVAPAEALQQAFGLSPAEFETTLASSRTKALQGRRIPPPLAFDRDNVQLKKLPDGEASGIREQFRAEQPETREQAVAALRQLLAADPDNVEAHRGLALSEFRAGEMKNAIDHTRRAIELRDDDARMQYLEGLWMNHGSRESIQMDSAAPSVVLHMTKAVEHDPEFADAHYMLSIAQLATRHSDEALASMKRAMALSPRNDFYTLAYARELIALGQPDEARSLLAYLKNSPDRLVAVKAAEALTSARRLSRVERQYAEQGLYNDPTAPQWRPKKPIEDDDKTEQAQPAAQPDNRKVEYLKGTLTSVRCADADKSAMLNVTSGKAQWQFRVADRTSVLLIGPDAFSCAWTNRAASVNYKATGQRGGDVVSLEMD